MANVLSVSGNSISADYGVSVGQGWQSQVIPLLNQTFLLNNTSVASESTLMQAVRLKNVYDAAQTGLRVYICFEGTNSLYFGVPVAIAVAQHVAMVRNAMASGNYSKALVGTVLPRGGSAPVSFSTITAFNDAIKNYVSPPWSRVIDFQSDAIMGDPAKLTDTVYYQDGVHPTATGHTRLAAIAASAINAVL